MAPEARSPLCLRRARRHGARDGLSPGRLPRRHHVEHHHRWAPGQRQARRDAAERQVLQAPRRGGLQRRRQARRPRRGEPAGPHLARAAHGLLRSLLRQLPSAQGLLFDKGFFYYQDATRIRRVPYKAGDRVGLKPGEVVIDIHVYVSQLHWPKTLDVADDGTIYVTNGGDQTEDCAPRAPLPRGYSQDRRHPRGRSGLQGIQKPHRHPLPEGPQQLLRQRARARLPLASSSTSAPGPSRGKATSSCLSTARTARGRARA